MNFEALNRFMSEENIRRHEGYLKNQRLKLSILEKSGINVIGKSIREIRRMNMDASLKRQILELKIGIESHERFFDSFAVNQNNSSRSEKLLYDIFKVAMETDHRFLYIYSNGQGLATSTDIPNCADFICIDLFEHCYFLDYGFKKDLFLRNALAYFDIGRVLDNSSNKRYN